MTNKNETNELKEQQEVVNESEVMEEITEVEPEQEIKDETKPIENESSPEGEAEPIEIETPIEEETTEVKPDDDAEVITESQAEPEVKVDSEPLQVAEDTPLEPDYKELYTNMKLQSIDSNFEIEFQNEIAKDYDDRLKEYVLFAAKHNIDYSKALEELSPEQQAIVVPFINDQFARTEYRKKMFYKQSALMKASLILDSKNVADETVQTIAADLRDNINSITEQRSMAEIGILVDKLLLENELRLMKNAVQTKTETVKAEQKPAIKAEIKEELKPQTNTITTGKTRIFTAEQIEKMSTEEYLHNAELIHAQINNMKA